MKSPAYRVLNKLLSTAIALLLPSLIGLRIVWSLGLRLNTIYYSAFTKDARIFSFFCIVFMITGGMISVWRREVYWTRRKKLATATLAITVFFLVAIGLAANNIAMAALILLLPPAFILAWSPFGNTSEQRVQEHDFGVTMRIFNPTVAKLMLSSMLWGPAFYISVIYYTGQHKDYWPELEFFPSIICLIVAALWTGIWFKAVSWTRRRTALTIIAAAIAVIVGLIQRSYTNKFGIELDKFSQNGAGLGLFIILTTIFWQNTAAERRHNLTDAKLYQNFDATPYCPECGFNLTGLKKLRCPECGRQYTLAKLLYDNVKMRDLDMQLDME